MRAAGYFRVSTEDQVEGWSLEAQRKSFEEFCQAKGWEIVSCYADEGKSAWTDSISKRPGFRRMLEDAKSASFDVVVTHTLDRFSRNLWVLLDSFRSLSASNVTFVSIQEQIDYTKPEGRLFVTMLGAFAQYFSDALSGHTRKGLKTRAQNGLYNGEPPFGYERCTEECRGQPGHQGCHVVGVKAELVKQLFLKYSEGSTSLSRLAIWLNDLGTRTNNRRDIRLGDGLVVSGPRPFTGYSVRTILHNRFYLGKVRHRDEEYPGLHEPLIDEAMFDEVQRGLTAARSRGQGGFKARRAYLLQGLVRCVHCGYPMWADSSGRSHSPRYRERPGLSGSRCEYGKWSIPGSMVDGQVETLFSNLTLPTDWKTWILERVSSASKRKAMMHERSLLEPKLSRLTEVYVEGHISKEEYDHRRREIQERLEALRIPEVDASIVAGTLLEDLGRLWQQADVEQRNRMLTSMLEAVFLDSESKAVVGLRPKPEFRDLFLCLETDGTVTIHEPENPGGESQTGMTEPEREIPEAPFDNGVGKIVSGNGAPLSNGNRTQRDSFLDAEFPVNKQQKNPREAVALMGGFGGDGGELNSPSKRDHRSDVLQAYSVVQSSPFGGTTDGAS